jgi:hypothetical protein
MDTPHTRDRTGLKPLRLRRTSEPNMLGEVIWFVSWGLASLLSLALIVVLWPR